MESASESLTAIVNVYVCVCVCKEMVVRVCRCMGGEHRKSMNSFGELKN